MLRLSGWIHLRLALLSQGREPDNKTAKAHHALPSLEELRHIEELAEKRIEGKPPGAYEELRGTGQVSADVFNLSDMRQLMRLQEYL